MCVPPSHHTPLSWKMAHEMPSQETSSSSPEPRSAGAIHYPIRKNMSMTRAQSIADHDVDDEDGPGAGVAIRAL